MTRNRRIIAGRPVMITGAASGIGRSLAQRLSRSGSPVAIADIDETGLKETARSLHGPDPEGLGRSHEQMAADFEAITMTTPDKAAGIICRGVERGKARILVGPDAYVFDALARVAPTHYYDLMARFEKRLRSRQAARQ